MSNLNQPKQSTWLWSIWICNICIVYVQNINQIWKEYFSWVSIELNYFSPLSDIFIVCWSLSMTQKCTCYHPWIQHESISNPINLLFAVLVLCVWTAAIVWNETDVHDLRIPESGSATTLSWCEAFKPCLIPILWFDYVCLCGCTRLC